MADIQKIRQTLIEDTILSLKGLLTKEYSLAVEGVIEADTSNLNKEATQQSILNNTNLLIGELHNKTLSFIKDGNVTQVVEDMADPINNTPLPVKLTSVTGDINITAGDLNVQLTDKGTNYDCTRIGDGTEELLINTDGSINTVSKIIVPNTGGTIYNDDVDTIAEQIDATSHPCKYCIVQSHFNNTDKLWIGLDSSVAENRGILLFPTDNIKLDISDTNLLYACASAPNQGVSITYFN